VPNVARFDAGMLKLQRMIKWDVFLGHGVEFYSHIFAAERNGLVSVGLTFFDEIIESITCKF